MHLTHPHHVLLAGARRRVPARASAVETAPAQSESAAQPSTSNGSGPVIINGQILHSIEPARLDVINSLEREGWVERELMKMLKPVQKSWQPADYLPDGADPDFLDKVCGRARATGLCELVRRAPAPQVV